ncbi:hypothetical protein OIDMADRAFT_26159 [Oidiodendron maius Zn]|uniref:Uncharacterized protein n=1 Tax=Oidiodendron maius (strain Zn) TaxID=913774 RepID=A0A0C3H5K4_OIDMZ|nr:hypothetical protein OIDMADRAFT_26159 [Oidiodendron maius Zn]
MTSFLEKRYIAARINPEEITIHPEPAVSILRAQYILSDFQGLSPKTIPMPKFDSETNAIDVVKDLPDQVKGHTSHGLTPYLCPVLITGPSPGGLGAETAISLAHGSPANIILIGRDVEKCQSTANSVQAINSSIKVKVVQAELSSLRSVRKAARAILNDNSIPTIDAIINNAGIMAIPLARNENDYEMQFAANHLGHFLLANLLIPKLAPRTGRVVSVSSSGNIYCGVNWDDIYFRNEGSYKPMRGYSQSKTANILFSVAQKKRGVRSYAVHPGSIQTSLSRHIDLDMAEDITRTIWGMSLHEAMESPEHTRNPGLEDQDGVFLSDRRPSTDALVVKSWSLDEKDAEPMWMLSEDLVGEAFDF